MNGSRPTVLVLGVGGNVSQGIVKALALGRLPVRVVGACVSHLSAGLYLVDRAYVSPYASDPSFLDWLLRVCEGEQVDAVLSGVEPVLEALAENAGVIRDRTGAIPLVSSSRKLAIGADKLRTAHWLEREGFAAPRSVDSADRDGAARLVSERGFPLFAKPRRGKGAEGAFRVEDDAGLDFALSRPDYVLQEHLDDGEGEFTVACFSDRAGAVRGSIAMRRGLSEGTTSHAEVGDYPEVHAEATRIAQRLGPLGPSNMQLRVSGGRPVCFEINVRFSGTAPIRARLGFNDVEATVRHYALGEPAAELPEVASGIALRYWNEIYVDPAAARELERGRVLADPSAHPLLVEDFGRREATDR